MTKGKRQNFQGVSDFDSMVWLNFTLRLLISSHGCSCKSSYVILILRKVDKSGTQMMQFVHSLLEIVLSTDVEPGALNFR